MAPRGSRWIRRRTRRNDQFVARAGDVSSTRIVNQVPGDPCSLKMNAKAAGGKIELETEPVRDCSGNAVLDGTIVTFTESYNGTRSTVDVPLKRGVARLRCPRYPAQSSPLPAAWC